MVKGTSVLYYKYLLEKTGQEVKVANTESQGCERVLRKNVFSTCQSLKGDWNADGNYVLRNRIS